MSIRALIVDDEPHAREGIAIRLNEYPEIEIAGECSSGGSAVESIAALKPDLVFLDIQMPEMNGFEVLQQVSLENMPLIIFVTAFDRYAIKAFEFHALDYLLKPISETRFREAVKAALSEVRHRNLQSYASKLQLMITDYVHMADGGEVVSNETVAGLHEQVLTRLMIRSKEQFLVIPVQEIDWVEAAGDYVYLYAGGQKHLFRETLSSLEGKLDSRVFVRIHRSAIVNVEKIKTLRPNQHGDFDVHLQNGMKLKLSRWYRDRFQKSFGTSF